MVELKENKFKKKVMKKCLLILLIGILVNIGSINAFGYSISFSGQMFIKKYEKCKLTAYWDGNGYTIGWGHHLLKNEKYRNISQVKANELFKKDIQKTNASINKLLNKFEGKVKFKQGFINGLGDLIYNCGEGGVKGSLFYKRLMKCRINNGRINKKDFDYTLSAVKTCKITSKGHKPRRQECYEMMRK